MKKFKKVLALSLALAMGLSLAACGGSSNSGNSGNSGSGDSGNASSNNGGSSDNNGGSSDNNGGSTDNGGASGSSDTFYIYVWNNEFRDLLASYMPDFTADDDHMGGTMADGTRIQFVENSNDGLNYQTHSPA